MARLIRISPPPGATGNAAIAVSGRNYSCAAGSTIDVLDADAHIMSANGWTEQGFVGTTAQRPTPQDAAPVLMTGLVYIDTTLGYAIRWDGAAWRNPSTGAAV